jgi:GAF domain-containing protein
MQSLDDVLLAPRPTHRVVDHAAEAAALHALARELDNPRADILGNMSEHAMALCGAGSAGISIRETGDDGAVFRWYGVRGAWARYEGGSLPVDASPCGIVIQRRAATLFRHPHTHFAHIQGEPKISQVLLAPFHMLGEPVGTVWVLLHDDSRDFDSEDVRIVEGLARFASTAFMMRWELEQARELRDEAVRRGDRLARTVQRLTGQEPEAV